MASKKRSSSAKSFEKTDRRNTAVPPTAASKAKSSKSAVAAATGSQEITQPAISTAAASIAAVLEAAQQVKAPVNNPRVDERISQLRDFTAETARDAAIELGQLGDRRAVEPLMAALANTDGFYHLVVRAAAAGSLGELRDHRAVAVLIDALRDSMAEISAEAALALGQIGTAEAISALRPLVENLDGYFLPMSRRAAIKAISRSLNADLRDLLSRIASNEQEDATVRQAVAQVLN